MKVGGPADARNTTKTAAQATSALRAKDPDMTMKAAIFCALAALLFAGSAGTAAAQTVVGDWLGTLTVRPGLDLRIAVHIHKSPQGAYSGSWDSVDQGCSTTRSATWRSRATRCRSASPACTLDTPPNGMRPRTSGSGNGRRSEKLFRSTSPAGSRRRGRSWPGWTVSGTEP